MARGRETHFFQNDQWWSIRRKSTIKLLTGPKPILQKQPEADLPASPEANRERFNLRLVFREVGSAPLALYVKAIANHPEGITMKDTYAEVVGMLGDTGDEEVQHAVGTFASFQEAASKRMTTVIKRKKDGTAAGLLIINPEFAELTQMVSDFTLAFSEEHWIPADYFFREPRSGDLYEPLRLHMARIIRQTLLSETGQILPDTDLHMAQIQQETAAKRNSLGRVIREFHNLNLCNYDFAHKGNSIVQLFLREVPQPEALQAISNERNRAVTKYPEMPKDLIEIMNQLGGTDLLYGPIGQRLQERYQSKYGEPYDQASLYTRVNKYMKTLERDGYISRNRKKISLIKQPEFLEEVVSSRSVIYPELPYDLFTLLQTRTRQNHPVTSLQETIRSLYHTYQDKTESPSPFSTIYNAVTDLVNDLVQEGYIGKETFRTGIQITSENDRHMFLDVAESYRLLLKKDPDFLSEIHSRATDICHIPQRSLAVALETQTFNNTPLSQRQSREDVIAASEVSPKVQEPSPTPSGDLQPGSAVVISRPKKLDNENMIALLQLYREDPGRNADEILAFCQPYMAYAVSLYQGFGRPIELLQEDVEFAMQDRLQTLLQDSEYPLVKFNPFQIAFTEIRNQLRYQVANGALVSIPDVLKSGVKLAEQILTTTIIDFQGLRDNIERERQINKSDVPRILFALELKEIAQEVVEKRLTRVHITSEKRKELQKLQEFKISAKIRQLVLLGKPAEYSQIRKLLKQEHEPIPANLADLITAVTQALINQTGPDEQTQSLSDATTKKAVAALPLISEPQKVTHEQVKKILKMTQPQKEILAIIQLYATEPDEPLESLFERIDLDLTRMKARHENENQKILSELASKLERSGMRMLAVQALLSGNYKIFYRKFLQGEYKE